MPPLPGALVIILDKSETDDPRFLRIAEELLAGLMRQRAELDLIAVKIRDWFGPKWLPFTAGTRGDQGEYATEAHLPAFVPSRVVSQRRFPKGLAEPSILTQPLHLATS